MKSVVASAIALVAAATFFAPTVFAADAAGNCGKGKVYDPDSQKCVAKPKGSGSHSG